MEYSIQDIIDATVEGEPTKVQVAFDHLLGQKIMDGLEARKRDIAQQIFSPTEAGEEGTSIESEAEAQNAEDENSQSA